MFSFLRNLRIDRASFWIGFVAASLLWWLIITIRPHWRELRQFFKQRFQAARQELQTSSNQRLHNDTLNHVQKLHLAAPLFSLDEILISPRVLAPKLPVIPDAEPLTEDITSHTIPRMPEAPELASAYGAPTLSLADVLQNDAQIALIGPPGSGKTTALAHLAASVLRGEVSHAKLQRRTPLFVHAANLNLGDEEQEHLADVILPGIAIYSSKLNQTRLPKYLRRTLESEQALLIIDGLDELPPKALRATLTYIQQIHQTYPGIQIVVSAAPNYLGTLPQLGFVPIAMAVWNNHQQAEFVQKWGTLWQRYFTTESDDEYKALEPMLLNGWLLQRTAALTPLAFTLQTWATYAGDVRGPTLSASLEAYIQRMTADTPKGSAALARLAAQAISTQRATFSSDEAHNWVRELLKSEADNVPLELAEADDEGNPPPKSITLPRVLPDLSQGGLLTPRGDQRLGFGHPLTQGYMAAKIFSNNPATEVYEQEAWLLRDLAIRFSAAQKDLSAKTQAITAPTSDPLHYGKFIAASWLSDIPAEKPWRRAILTQAATTLRDESLSLPVRGRMLAALAHTHDPHITTLLRHLLQAPQPSTRQLAALGSGFVRDIQAVQALTALINDLPAVSRAACLALAQIGTQAALEALANALLQGSEETRRAAAEAFANHPEEGYPTLREAVQVDDILVRRAAIYGLQRIRQPWALEILEVMQIEDAQWVVKNAAVQAFEELQQPDPRIPAPLQPPETLPWLIKFAAKQGAGVSAGEPAQLMLLRALEQGTPEEQLAALQYLQQSGTEKIFPAIYHLYLDPSEPELQQAAYETLWQLRATGFELPEPLQYGLG